MSVDSEENKYNVRMNPSANPAVPTTIHLPSPTRRSSSSAPVGRPYFPYPNKCRNYAHEFNPREREATQRSIKPKAGNRWHTRLRSKDA